MTEEECAGAGKCHGPLKWCSSCGDVAHVCDMRLRDETCTDHPIPPTSHELRRSRAAAEQEIVRGERMVRDGKAELAKVEESERARRIFNVQLEWLVKVNEPRDNLIDSSALGRKEKLWP